MKKDTWIIAANSTHARIFKLDNMKMIELDALVHPESRMHGKDLTTERPGRSHESLGARRSSIEPQHSPKRNEAIEFAREVAELIENARSHGKIDRLFVAAAPSFLGLLRQEMGNLSQKMINFEVSKDITQCSPDEILSYFPIGF